MKNVVDLFLELVQIDSPSGNEVKISLFLQDWLTNHGFLFQIDSVGNIYATNNKEGDPLLLCTHMDTVQPGESIHPLIKNGIIKSDGKTILGADNKAALAAILYAIENTHIDRAIELLFTVKEETGGGVEYFPFDWIKSKHGIIFDKSSPLGGIVLSSPFIYNFHAIFFGKAAHSSTPQNGINAFIPAFNALSHISVGQLDNEKTTINVGVIKGGTGINTIPDTIQISGEVRSYDEILFQLHLKKIHKLFEQESKKYNVKFSFSKDSYCAGYSFSKSDTFIKQIALTYKSEGLKTQYYEHSGISDANVLNDHGIHTINLTDGTQFPHTTNEQITIKNLESLSQIIVSCISRL